MEVTQNIARLSVQIFSVRREIAVDLTALCVHAVVLRIPIRENLAAVGVQIIITIIHVPYDFAAVAIEIPCHATVRCRPCAFTRLVCWKQERLGSRHRPASPLCVRE
jgi:hypothetical protein